MNLIKISHKYYINTDKYEKIKIDDIFSSQNELFKAICYPEVKKAIGGTEKRTYPIIQKIIRYEKIKPSGNKIKIISKEPTHKLNEIIKNELESILKEKIENSPTFAPRESYIHDIDFLLDYIFLQSSKPQQCITISKIIELVDIFPYFYYEYNAIRYNENFPSEDEILELQYFAENHSLSDYYLLNTMIELNEIVFGIFNKRNILGWGSRKEIEIERLLFKGDNQLTDYEIESFEDNYIKPLEEEEIPTKDIIRMANINYMRDRKIPTNKHKWIHYKYKIIKNNETLSLNEEEFIIHQKELNKKILGRLKSKIVDAKGEIYHKVHKEELDYIISRLEI